MLEWDDAPAVAPSAEAATRVTASIKRLILGTGDVNQLVPFKYKWAWANYLKATENHWMPAEVALEYDALRWNSDAPSIREREAVWGYIGHLAGLDALYTSNYLIGTYRYITAPEVRQYYLRQGFERTIHHQCALQVSEALGATAEPNTAIAEKLAPYHAFLASPGLGKQDPAEEAGQFLEAFFAMFVLADHVYSYPELAEMRLVCAEGRYPGIAQQITLISRDRQLHLATAAEVFQGIVSENPWAFTSVVALRIDALLNEALRHVTAVLEARPCPEKDRLQQGAAYLTNRIRQLFGLPRYNANIVPAFDWQ